MEKVFIIGNDTIKLIRNVFANYFIVFYCLLLKIFCYI